MDPSWGVIAEQIFKGHLTRFESELRQMKLQFSPQPPFVRPRGAASVRKKHLTNFRSDGGHTLRKTAITIPRLISRSADHFNNNRGVNIMGRGILLWLLGVPLPIILLLAMCSHH